MYFSFKSFVNSHYVFASTPSGGLLRKPMNQPLNGVAEIPQAHARKLWSWISPVIEIVGPWNLRIRVSYIPNYKTAISAKIICWEGEQLPLISVTYTFVAVGVLCALPPFSSGDFNFNFGCALWIFTKSFLTDDDSDLTVNSLSWCITKE